METNEKLLTPLPCPFLLFFSCKQSRYIYEDVDRQWKGHNVDGDPKISWQEYNQTTYSGLTGETTKKGSRKAGLYTNFSGEGVRTAIYIGLLFKLRKFGGFRHSGWKFGDPCAPDPASVEPCICIH